MSNETELQEYEAEIEERQATLSARANELLTVAFATRALQIRLADMEPFHPLLQYEHFKRACTSTPKNTNEEQAKAIAAFKVPAFKTTRMLHAEQMFSTIKDAYSPFENHKICDCISKAGFSIAEIDEARTRLQGGEEDSPLWESCKRIEQHNLDIANYSTLNTVELYFGSAENFDMDRRRKILVYNLCKSGDTITRFDEQRLIAVSNHKNLAVKMAALEIYKSNRDEWKSGGDSIRNNINGQFIFTTAYAYLRMKQVLESLDKGRAK